MEIKDLKPRMNNISIVAEVIDIGEAREFDKFGRKIRVANATIKDDSGETKLTLWNDDIDKVKPGMKVKITNGYVNEFQGEMQLTAGKFGKLEILGESEERKESEEEKPKEESEFVEEENVEEESE